MSIHKAKSIPHGFNDLGMILVYVGQTSFENYYIFLVSFDFRRYYEGWAPPKTLVNSMHS